MLAVHFKMFSREERAAVEPVLQRLLDGLCADITAVAVEYDRLQIRDRYYGDADFRIRRVESTLPAEDRIGDGVALILQDVSANWRARLEVGFDYAKRDYLRVVGEHKARDDFDAASWEDLEERALSGRAFMRIDARRLPSGWSDQIPVIDFSCPLRQTLRIAIEELRGKRRSSP